MSDDFFFQCSKCGERRAFKFRYLTEKNEDICSKCLHKRGYFTVSRYTPSNEDVIKFGRKLMKKRIIPEKHIVVMDPDPAEDLEVRLNTMWDASGREPIFSYSVTKVPLAPRPLGVKPKPSEAATVLVIQDSTYGFFNLQWLEYALKLKPRIRVVNANFLKGKNGTIRMEIFLEYVDKPPKYIVKPF